jgi:hypothetical protein
MKFSTHDCPSCAEMAGFDASVAAELGLSFLDVDMRNVDSYKLYRKYLLYHRSGRRTIALPTYILVDMQDDEFSVHGELMGLMSLDRFRCSLANLLTDDDLETAQQLSLKADDNCTG